VGCGRNKFPGAVGIDRLPGTAADIVHDLDQFPWPVSNSSFDEIRLTHVIEHVGDVIRTLEEVHRIGRAGARVHIATPHYTDFSSFCDPTHRWHLNSYSLRYFGQDNAGYGYYSAARFREVSVRVRLLSLWRLLGLEWAINAVPRLRRWWEYYACFVIRGKSIEWELEVIK
jgi:hypothetical protein